MAGIRLEEERKVAEGTVFTILAAISFSHLLNDLVQSLLPAIYPILKTSYHLDFAKIGLITLTYQLTASLLQPLIGLYTDRRPQPYSLPFGMGFTLLGLVLLSMASNFVSILVAAAFVGAGSAVFHPESSRVARLASGGQHGLAQSVFQVGGNAGQALGPLLAAFVIVGRGQRSIIWFTSGDGGHRAVDADSAWYKQRQAFAVKSRASERVIHAGLSSRKVAGSLAVLIALMFSKFVYLSSLNSYYTFYLIGKFHMSLKDAELHLFVFLFAVAAGTVIGGPIGDRIGRKYVIWCSILGVLPFTLLLPHANLFWTSVLSVVIGLILASAFSAIVVYAQELMPGRSGDGLGAFFGFAFGMAGLGAAVLGKLADATSITFVYQVCAFLPAIGLLRGSYPTSTTAATERHWPALFYVYCFKMQIQCAALLLLASITSYAQSTDVIYENARLIIGDASAPIETGAFLVENGHILAIGPRSSVKAPAGVTHVDLTGKTVMPAMNNVHIHIGYEGYLSWSVENHTPENVLDHLEREAFYGVGTAMAMGDQPTDFAIQFQQDQLAGKFPPAARFFFAAGLAPPGGGPDALLIQGTTPLHAVYEVSTPDEAVAAVRKIAARKIKQVKFWVDNRDNKRGSMKKMPPEVYTAIITEAHKHGMTTHAHATSLEDQKGVVKAGVDVLVHTLMAEKLDDELATILKEKKPYWAPVMGLSDRSELCDGANPFIEQVLPDGVVADIRAGRTWLPSSPCAATATAQITQREENLRYNFPKYIAAGARIVLGTDAGLSAKYSYGFAEHHEIGMYVKLGLTPAEAMVASTSRPTEVLGIHDTGTLAKGKRADFIVLRANPLENIRNTREIDAVYLYGLKLDREALQRRFKRAEKPGK